MTSEEHAHHFSSWTKERLAEIDATTSIETQFQGALHKQQHEGEAAWAKAKTAGALPTNPKAAVFKNVQGRVMEFAMENTESAFTYAGKICNALTVRDIVMLQTQFAQDRMQAFVKQGRDSAG